jgi:hypothetical protein
MANRIHAELKATARDLIHNTGQLESVYPSFEFRFASGLARVFLCVDLRGRGAGGDGSGGEMGRWEERDMQIGRQADEELNYP